MEALGQSAVGSGQSSIVRRLPHEVIARRIAEKHGLPLAEIRSPSHRHVLYLARAEIYLAMLQLDWSLPRIGKYFRRDHTTIRHALQVTAPEDYRHHCEHRRLAMVAERAEIVRLRQSGLSFYAIAERIGRCEAFARKAYRRATADCRLPTAGASP